jgi:O-methyltransferase/aklanonic acid methyltransferase
MPEPIIVTKQMIEKVFDDAATTYNRVGPSIFTQWGTHLIEQMPLAPGQRVLDVATGTGAVLFPAARRVGTGGHVTGIDLSGAIIQEAERNARAEGLNNVAFRKMDAEHLEFPDQAFDVVTCAFALFLFPDIEAALREMYRVCKPGACIGVTVFDKTPLMFAPGLPLLMQQYMASGMRMIRMPQPMAYAPEEVEALLSQSGFRSIKTHSETNDIIYASADDFWAFALTTAARGMLLSMNEETRARFKDEYFAKLRPMFRPDGLHVSVAVVYALAQR